MAIKSRRQADLQLFILMKWGLLVDCSDLNNDAIDDILVRKRLPQINDGTTYAHWCDRMVEKQTWRPRVAMLPDKPGGKTQLAKLRIADELANVIKRELREKDKCIERLQAELGNAQVQIENQEENQEGERLIERDKGVALEDKALWKNKQAEIITDNIRQGLAHWSLELASFCEFLLTNVIDANPGDRYKGLRNRDIRSFLARTLPNFLRHLEEIQIYCRVTLTPVGDYKKPKSTVDIEDSDEKNALHPLEYFDNRPNRNEPTDEIEEPLVGVNAPHPKITVHKSVSDMPEDILAPPSNWDPRSNDREDGIRQAKTLSEILMQSSLRPLHTFTDRDSSYPIVQHTLSSDPEEEKKEYKCDIYLHYYNVDLDEYEKDYLSEIIFRLFSALAKAKDKRSRSGIREQLLLCTMLCLASPTVIDTYRLRAVLDKEKEELRSVADDFELNRLNSGSVLTMSLIRLLLM